MKLFLIIIGILSIVKGLGFFVAPDIMNAWASFFVRYLDYWMNRKRLAGQLAIAIGLVLVILGILM